MERGKKKKKARGAGRGRDEALVVQEILKASLFVSLGVARHEVALLTRNHWPAVFLQAVRVCA